ncbi:putative helicase [Klebsiella michiganensis]|nr:putative helicase [Klebsiella michiganensis]
MKQKAAEECSQCHFVKPAGIYICPKCGFKPLAGEDVETDKSRGLKKVSKAEVKYTAEQKQSWWSQILFTSAPAQRRDARSVMAGVRIPTNKKFSVWPRGLHHTPQQITPEVTNFIKSKQIAFAKRKEKEGDAA